MSSAGRRLLSSIVYSGDAHRYITMALTPDLFRESELVLFNAINNHVMQYGVIPAPETIHDLLPDDAGPLVEVPEPPDFYLHEVEARYLHTTLSMLVSQSRELLVEKKADEAFSLITKHLTDLYASKRRRHLFDFRDAYELVLSEYKLAMAGGSPTTLLFGWPTLDEMTGGLREGDFCSYTGRPAAGKTFQLLYTAIQSWVTGTTPLFISMEMNTTIIVQRLAAMATGVNLTKLLKAEMTNEKFALMKAGLKVVGEQDHPLWIVDGNLATKVEDIVFMCHQLKPTSVFVDGAYLLRHKDSRMNKWDKIATNAEMLKQVVATDLGMPVVASYQLNREVTKKKSADKKGVEDIYGSDAIGQLSTVSLGLFQEEGVETLKGREVTILKGRNGEAGKFKINWDFDNMDFSEVLPPSDGQEDGNLLAYAG